MPVSDTINQAATRERLLRMPQVEELVGLKKSAIYNLMKAGRFVQPIRLSARCVVWPESACQKWIQDRISESTSNQAEIRP
ncbi:helix-turn-helix transcriptional regulator [Leptothrix sp. BB-4]